MVPAELLMSDYDVLSEIRFVINPLCNPKGASKNSAKQAVNARQAAGVVGVYTNCATY